jgi:hypothetical protein
MLIVLCDANDLSALWAYQALRNHGLAPLELITADALSLCEYWEHRVIGRHVTLRFRLENGLYVSSDQLRGVLNRLYTVPIPHWRSATKSDQDYVQQELIAFYLSWLYSLPCPVINRPTPQGLSGRWRHESEWVWLAWKAGLPVAPYRQSGDDLIDAMKGEMRLVAPGIPVRTIIVVGDTVVGAAAPTPVILACQQLAHLADTELLGIDFIAGAAGTWTFAGANATPDLSLGGPALIPALIHLLGV